MIASHEGRRHKRKRGGNQAAAACAVGMLLAGSASGEIVHLIATGTVAYGTYPPRIGATMRLEMDLDSEWEDRSDLPYRGFYYAINEVTLTMEGPGALPVRFYFCDGATVSVQDNVPGETLIDSFLIRSTSCTGDDLQPIIDLYLQLSGPSESISSTLPTALTPQSLASFGTHEIVLDIATSSLLVAYVDSIELVPEPTACAPVALLVLAALRRRNAAC